MIKHTEQRVGVFVDVANMYHSAKNVYGARVNFGEILKEAVAGRKLVRANAYVVKSPSQEEQNFLEALTKLGFDLKIKDLQIYPNGAKKADWDVGLSIDAIKLSDKVDSVVIVSGDGDYIPLLAYLRENKGCTVEVIAFGETTNTKLKEAADDFIDLSKDKRRFLMNGSSNSHSKYTRSASHSNVEESSRGYKSTTGDTAIDRVIAAVEQASVTRPTARTSTRQTARNRKQVTRRSISRIQARRTIKK